MATQIIASQGEHLESRPLITSSRAVHPAQLDDAGREALFHELLVINQQVFEGPWLQAISQNAAIMPMPMMLWGWSRPLSCHWASPSES